MIKFVVQPSGRIKAAHGDAMWENFMMGGIHPSPSGLTAAYLAERAQREGVAFSLIYMPEFKSYTVVRELL